MHVIVAALTYYLAGLLGLQLAIPPGFASAVWPASGLALALAILLKPGRAILGVAIGSFLLNTGVATDWYSQVNAASLWTPLGIASGATLQTYVGLYLFRWRLGQISLLETLQQSVSFTVVVALMGCIVAASAGALTLYLAGFVSTANIGFTWWTWWVGDSLGVILFTPFVLMIFSKDSRLKLWRKLLMSIPTGIIFITILLLFFNSVNYRNERINADINEKATFYIAAIQEKLANSQSRLQAYSAFYQASAKITLEDFTAFCNELLKNDGVLYGVGWSEIVPHDKRTEIEERIRSEGIPHFQFTEFSQDHQIVPV